MPYPIFHHIHIHLLFFMGRQRARVSHGLGHAGQSFQAPCFPAGMSKRMGAFYEKTGVSQHRTEPGFRDKNFSGRLSMFESVWVIQLGWFVMCYQFQWIKGWCGSWRIMAVWQKECQVVLANQLVNEKQPVSNVGLCWFMLVCNIGFGRVDCPKR